MWSSSLTVTTRHIEFYQARVSVVWIIACDRWTNRDSILLRLRLAFSFFFNSLVRDWMGFLVPKQKAEISWQNPAEALWHLHVCTHACALKQPGQKDWSPYCFYCVFVLFFSLLANFIQNVQWAEEKHSYAATFMKINSVINHQNIYLFWQHLAS